MKPDATPVSAEYVPNWKGRCEACGHSPTVDVFTLGKLALRTSLCGVCTWGSTADADPARWNSQEPS